VTLEDAKKAISDLQEMYEKHGILGADVSLS